MANFQRIAGSVEAFVDASRREMVACVGVHQVLRAGSYLAVSLSFKHWGLGLSREEIPKAVLAVHSSKRVFVEKLQTDPSLLADAVIQLLLNRGTRHPVSEPTYRRFLTIISSFDVDWIDS